MNCDALKDKLYDLLFDLLDPEEKRAAEAHLADCPDCRRRLEEAKREAALLREWQAPQPPDHLADQTIAAIQSSRIIRPVEPAMRWLGGRRFWQIAAAAVILIAAGVLAKTWQVTSAHAAPVEMSLYGESELTPGRTAAFRVLVQDGRKAAAIPGAKVRLAAVSAKGKKVDLGAGRTDSDGVVALQAALPSDLPEGDYIIQASLSSSAGEAEVSRSVTVKRSFRVLVTTDKPMYQPGQTIHIRSLTLASADRQPASGRDVVIEVQDSKGNKVFKKRGVASAFGVFAADFVLADQVNTGDYTIAANVGDTRSERGVTVDRYVLPKFKVELQADRGYYLPGQTVKLDLNAQYTFGKPVTGGKVLVSAEEFIEKYRPFAEASALTDESGRCHLEIPLGQAFVGQNLNKGDALVKLTAKVADTAGHTQEKTITPSVTAEPIRIELFPESGELVQNVENILYVVTAYPDGRPARTTVTMGAERTRLETSELGIGKMKITPVKTNLHLTVTAEDRQGLRSTVQRALRVGERTDAFLLRTDRVVYTAGQAARIEILSAAPRARVFLDVVQDRRTWLMQTINVENGRGSLDLDFPTDLAGTVELHSYRILADGNMVRDLRVIQINKADDLRIAAELDKPTYRPGEQAILKFLVQRHSGDPVQAALGLAGVDEAVFALSSMQPGLERVYFMLQEEILKPRYEIHAPMPITPNVTVAPSGTATPGTEEASVVLFSAASGSSGPARSAGKPQAEKQKELESKKAAYLRNLQVAAAYAPFILFILFALPIILYAVIRFFARQPIEKADPKEVHQFRRRVRSVSWLCLGGILIPIPVIAGLADRVNLILPSVLFAVILMLGLLIAAVVRARACSISQATPLLRKILGCVPWTYGLGVLAMFTQVFAMDAVLRLQHFTVVWLAIIIIAFLSSGALFVAAEGVAQRINRVNWYLWSFGYVLAALTLFVLFFPVTERLGVMKLEAPLVRLKPAFQKNWIDVELPKAMNQVVMEKRDWLEGDIAQSAISSSMSAPEVRGKLVLDRRAPAETPLKAPARIRQYFPETLFWKPELITGNDGKAELQIPLADSITTWRIAMNAVSAAGELGGDTRSLRVFQDFFVDIDFPVALTQNDEVRVPIAVFNYLDKPQKVRLEPQPVSWCRFLDSDPVKTLDIEPRTVTSVYLPLRAIQPGRHSLTVKAFGSEMADAIEREVTVTPDGQLVEQVLNGALNENLTKELIIPKEALDGASDLFAKIYPGSFSQVLEGMDGILQMPSGCFEQTSSTTYPNILVLDYMRRTRRIKPGIEMKALNFINLGYQRLVSYEVKGGGFDWFGHSPAHPILTAYGLMEFHDMSQVYEIDPAVIARTRAWLRGMQKPDGTWDVARGGISEGAIDRFQQGNTLRNTAYIAWALAASGDARAPELERALAYVARSSNQEQDPYTLALCANALGAAGRKQDAKPILNRLNEKRIEDKNLIHWKSAGEGVTYSRGDCLDIETTALIAYGMLKAGVYVESATKALDWIVAHKDAAGTWGSTQATIHAMRALLAGTGPMGRVEGTLHITVAANGKAAEELTITPETSDVFRLVNLRSLVHKGKNVVALETAGKGSLSYQVVARHYMPWPDKTKTTAGEEPLKISVDYDATTVKKDDLLKCRVSIRYNREGAAEMTIVDLGIPPGFELQPEAFESLKERRVIERYSVTGRQAILYLRQIRGNHPVEFEYRLKAKFPVRAKTPVSTVYQYYEPEVRAEAAPVLLTVR
jgi:anti-sigma factor RsiW